MTKIKHILLISTLLTGFLKVNAAESDPLVELSNLIARIQGGEASFNWLSLEDRDDLANPHSTRALIIARTQAPATGSPAYNPADDLREFRAWLNERQAFHDSRQTNH